MFSLFQRAILVIIASAILILIRIGDAILWFLTKLLKLPKLIFILVQKIEISMPKSRAMTHKPRKPRRVSLTVIYPMPIGGKLKFFLFGAFFSLFVFFLPALVILFLQSLPNPKELASSQVAQTTKIYDRNGTLLYEIYAGQNRTIVPLSQIPKSLVNATIAIEDKGFYNHEGVDFAAILRAAKETFINKNLQGGSTITQQLVKTAILTPEISVTRKTKEVVLALWAEKLYTKEQILEMYFNYVPYGGTAWGVEAASKLYFGKKVGELTLSQSAFLAGLPVAPSIYSPFSSTPNMWKARQLEVLKRMADLGLVTKAEAEEAEKEALVFRQPNTPILAPHFVMYVRDFLVKRYGIDVVERGGLNVITTLDLTTQQNTEDIVRDEVKNAAPLLISNGTALITKPESGEILAMVGSIDYFDTDHDGNVNATLSLRPPGSSIKIVTYAAALGRGYTAASLIDDSPISYPDGVKNYTPVNYDGKFHGRVPLRMALGNSLNIPAVKTLNSLGLENMVELGKKMGILSWGDSKQYGLSITLGGVDVTMLDLARVYGTVANKGVRKELNPILKITNYKGGVIEQASGFDKGKRILPESIAFILSDILSDNNARTLEFGPNSPLHIDGKKVSVKTGTSDNKRDNWAIGYTPDILVAAWVGNFDNSPMNQALASGITGAAPMWRRIMLAALSKNIDGQTEWKVPEDIVSVPCQGRTEFFIKGTEKNAPCRWFPAPTATPSASPTP